MGAINGFSEYSELVENATHAVIEKGYLRNLYEYSYPAGHPHQLAAGSRWLEQLGVHADIEHMAIMSGAQNALTVALISLFAPGSRIAVDEYTYANFIELAKLLHLILVPIKQDECGMMPQELQKQCRANNIKGIYLIPSCSNPTAVTIPLERRCELAAAISENSLILIEDDIAAWLSAAGGSVLPSLFDLLSGQSIYICGMTKSLCPGLRIAYTAFGEYFKKAIMHGLINANIKTSSLDAEIITELILNGDAYKIAARKQQWAKQNCLLYAEYFPMYAGKAAEPRYYQWLPLHGERSGLEIENELLQRGVRIYHSQRFAVGRNTSKNFLRISLCSAKSSRKLKQGLSILKDCLLENNLLL